MFAPCLDWWVDGWMDGRNDGWKDGCGTAGAWPDVNAFIAMTIDPMVIGVQTRCPWHPFDGAGLRLRHAPAACACGVRLGI